MQASFDASLFSVETSPVNEYGERVAANVIYNPEDGRVIYRCRDSAWKTEFKRWQKDTDAPEPMSDGHCMFVRPLSYGYLPLGENRPFMIRRALRSHLVYVLRGWDRELRKSPEGMRQLAKIVRATLNAKMNGENTGAFPFIACVSSML